MKKTLRAFGIFLFTAVLLSSCSSDDGGTPTGNSQLLNKWWYSPDGSTADLKFNSNGSYTQNFAEWDITSDGDWEWENESQKIMHVYNVTNNAADEFWYKFNSVEAHDMTAKISFDGESWSDSTYEFQDSDN